MLLVLVVDFVKSLTAARSLEQSTCEMLKYMMALEDSGMVCGAW